MCIPNSNFRRPCVSPNLKPPNGVSCLYTRLGGELKLDRPQIVYGLLCDRDGRPIAVEMFPGNTADPKALTQFVGHVRQRFGIESVVFVGDRGMITSARIDGDLRDVDRLEWISALRSDAIRRLVDAGHVDRSSFDEKDPLDRVSCIGRKYEGIVFRCGGGFDRSQIERVKKLRQSDCAGATLGGL